jgi:hypothetical protein
MKFGLRTLLIAAIFGPPILAGVWSFLGYAREFLTILEPMEWAVLGLVGTLVMLPLVLCSWALVKLGHRDDGDRGRLLLRQVSLDLTIFALFVIVGIPAIVVAVLTIMWGWPL